MTRKSDINLNFPRFSGHFLITQEMANTTIYTSHKKMTIQTSAK